jgi:nickel and cobalt resistance protein CnrR
MRRVWPTILVTAIVAFAAGALGVYIGLQLFTDRAGNGSLDAAVHRELDLSVEQEVSLEAIEARFEQRRNALEAEMRAATREISDALDEEKSYTPRLERAVNRFHDAMGRLQHETILHVLEMRGVLSSEQQTEFDEIVRRELLSASEDLE